MKVETKGITEPRYEVRITMTRQELEAIRTALYSYADDVPVFRVERDKAVCRELDTHLFRLVHD